MCSATFLKRISDTSGSAVVEAALVYPLVVLILAGLISLSLNIMEQTGADAARHREEALRSLEPGLLTTENVLRGVWVLDE